MISIIIANYNSYNYIKDTLKSIASQSHNEFECIIVDDCSEDNSVTLINEFIKTDNRFLLFENQVNQGHVKSRKRGFDMSIYPYICFFDSDDLMDEFCLERRFNKLVSGNFDFVSCGINRFKDNINVSKKISFKKDGNCYVNHLIGKSSFYSVANLWKKNFLIDNDLFFKTDEIPLEDYSMNLRALKLTKNYLHLDETLIYYRMHENSISAELSNLSKDLLIGEFKVRRKFFTNILLDHYPKVYDFYLERMLWIYRGLLVNKISFQRNVCFEILRVYLRKIEIFKIIKFISISILVIIFNKGYHKIR